MTEIYKALAADSRRLAAMGARTVIDMFATDKVGDVGGFKRKLSKLVQEGYLVQTQSDVLEAVLEVGNAASHRGHCPSIEHMNAVMDIVENLLESTTFEKIADELKNATPSRSQGTV